MADHTTMGVVLRTARPPLRLGLSGAVAALVVVISAAAALVLTGNSTPSVSPAPSPVPGAVLRPSEADGVVVYGSLLSHAGAAGWMRGLMLGTAAGGPPRVVTGGVVCCVSVAAGHVLITERHAGGTRDLIVDAHRPHAAAASVDQPGLVAGPGVLAADGSRFAVYATRRSDTAGAIFLGARSPGPWGRLTPFSHHPSRPLAFSPDGSRLLVYRAGASAHSGILEVVDVPSGRTARVTPAGMTSACCYWGAPASWSPHGRIAFAAFGSGTAGAEGQSAVFVARGDGSHVRRISDWGTWITGARWSPDGRWIAFDQMNRGRTGLHDLFVVHPDGTAARVVRSTFGRRGSCCAQWTPNSRALVYQTGHRDGHMDLWTTNIDGTGLFHLTSDESSNLAYAVG